MSQSGNNNAINSATISASQSLTVPIGKNLASATLRTLVPTSGAIAYDDGTNALYFGTPTAWVQLAIAV
jgi:hypothetical protein